MVLRTCRQLPAGSIPATRTREGTFLYYSDRELIIPEVISVKQLAAGKTAWTRGGMSLPERRDGFRIMRLVMSIIFSHISRRGK